MVIDIIVQTTGHKHVTKGWRDAGGEKEDGRQDGGWSECVGLVTVHILHDRK